MLLLILLQIHLGGVASASLNYEQLVDLHFVLAGYIVKMPVLIVTDEIFQCKLSGLNVKMPH